LFPNLQQLDGAHGEPPTTVDSPSNTAVPPTELDERLKESRKRHREDPHPSILPPPIPDQLHHCQNGARRPAAKDNMHLIPAILVANREYRASEIDKNMLGRLDRETN